MRLFSEQGVAETIKMRDAFELFLGDACPEKMEESLLAEDIPRPQVCVGYPAVRRSLPKGPNCTHRNSTRVTRPHTRLRLKALPKVEVTPGNPLFPFALEGLALHEFPPGFQCLPRRGGEIIIHRSTSSLGACDHRERCLGKVPSSSSKTDAFEVRYIPSVFASSTE